MDNLREKKGAWLWLMIYFLLHTVVSVAVSFGSQLIFIAANRAEIGTMTEPEYITFITDFTSRSLNWLTIIVNILCVVIIIVIGGLMKVPPARQTGLDAKIPGGKSTAWMCLALGVALNFWLSVFMDFLPLPESVWMDYEQSVSAVDGGSILAQLISVVIFAPIAEELLFREKVFSALKNLTTVPVAIVLQGVLFGVIHGNLLWIIYASAIGMVMGYIRHITGSVRASILVHMAFNAGSYLLGIVLNFMVLDLELAMMFVVSGIVVAASVVKIKNRCAEERLI